MNWKEVGECGWRLTTAGGETHLEKAGRAAPLCPACLSRPCPRTSPKGGGYFPSLGKNIREAGRALGEEQGKGLWKIVA